jgi:hypothetical protein
MRHLHTACLCGALFVALTIAAPSRAGAEHFDPQKYFEAKAKDAAHEQAKNAWRNGAGTTPPLSGGASEITTVTHGAWIAIGIAGAAVVGVVILWLKTPVFHFSPRVDDAIDKEFRAMIHETGEEPGEDPDAPEDDFGAPRRAPLNEDDIIEDLTGEKDDRPENLAGGRAT